MNIESANEANQDQEYSAQGVYDLVLDTNQGSANVLTAEEEQEFDLLLKEIHECINQREYG